MPFTASALITVFVSRTASVLLNRCSGHPFPYNNCDFWNLYRLRNVFFELGRSIYLQGGLEAVNSLGEVGRYVEEDAHRNLQVRIDFAGSELYGSQQLRFNRIELVPAKRR